MSEEPKKPKKSSALTRLTPKATVLQIDGTEVRVPGTREENSFVNMAMFSLMRNSVFEAMKEWKNKGLTPTPKELRDIAETMKVVSNGSDEVYKMTEPPKDNGAGGPVEVTDDAIDFSAVNKIPEVKTDGPEKS